jgi:hypothetical protein
VVGWYFDSTRLFILIEIRNRLAVSYQRMLRPIHALFRTTEFLIGRKDWDMLKSLQSNTPREYYVHSFVSDFVLYLYCEQFGYIFVAGNPRPAQVLIADPFLVNSVELTINRL